MEALLATAGASRTAPLCAALGVSRASLYRDWQRSKRPPGPRIRAVPVLPRALCATQRAQVLDVLHAPRFVDLPVHQVYATLLDEGQYLCSPRTMYRILAQQGEVRERRAVRAHPVYARPELLATAPNQLWSWDITKLKGPQKWSYFHLYAVIDVFSRYTVAWMVAHRESTALATHLFAQTCAKQHIPPGQLTLHADRGPSMRSKPLAMLLADLGVTKTHSRPHVSNDNPYSESQFKTLKYRPQFPERFGSIQDARAFCEEFFHWYNTQHHHSGIALLTPETVHYGHDKEITRKRQAALDRAYQQHPERFVAKPPQAPKLPQAVWINPPSPKTENTQNQESEKPETTQENFPN